MDGQTDGVYLHRSRRYSSELKKKRKKKKKKWNAFWTLRKVSGASILNSRRKLCLEFCTPTYTLLDVLENFEIHNPKPVWFIVKWMQGWQDYSAWKESKTNQSTDCTVWHITQHWTGNWHDMENSAMHVVTTGAWIKFRPVNHFILPLFPTPNWHDMEHSAMHVVTTGTWIKFRLINHFILPPFPTPTLITQFITEGHTPETLTP